MGIRLSQIAKRLGVPMHGRDRKVSALQEPGSAGPEELTLVFEKRWLSQVSKIRSRAWLLSRSLWNNALGVRMKKLGISCVIIERGYEDIASVIDQFHPEPSWRAARHKSVVIDPSARIGKKVSLGAWTVVGSRTNIANDVRIGAHCVIGSKVVIGRGSTLHANVTIYDGCRIGENVIVHSGTVIGSDGFGFYEKNGVHHKIRHAGTVIVEDDVEIGALCAIDRGTLGATRIGKGSKLDNLIQVAHNVEIGPHTLIAAQAGIAGSTKIGSRVKIGGQAGLVGHITIGDNASIAAQAGVIGSVAPGITVSGYPAREHRLALRREASLNRLLDSAKPLKKK